MTIAMNLRLVIAAICTVSVFLFNLTPYAMKPGVMRHEIEKSAITFVEVLLPSIAFVVLLPVIVRGSGQRKLLALILALPAGYLAYQGWDGFISEFFIYGY